MKDIHELAAAARRLVGVEGVTVSGERATGGVSIGRPVHASLRAVSDVAFPQQVSIDRDGAYGTVTFLPLDLFGEVLEWMDEDAHELREDVDETSTPERRFELEAATSGVPFAVAGDEDFFLVLASGRIGFRGGEGPTYHPVADSLAELLTDGIAVAFRCDGREREALDRTLAEVTGLAHRTDNGWVRFWRRLRGG